LNGVARVGAAPAENDEVTGERIALIKRQCTHLAVRIISRQQEYEAASDLSRIFGCKIEVDSKSNHVDPELLLESKGFVNRKQLRRNACES
jgi:hypothetical protein